MIYDAARYLLDGLRATPEIIATLLAGVTQEQAAQARGGDENWSVVEVLCHLRDAEERTLQRLEQMLEEDNPALPGYDQEAWARERNYAAQDLRAAFDDYAGFRVRFVARLEALSPEQWQRSAEFGNEGQITVLMLALDKVVHDAVHAAQIGRQLRLLTL